MPVDAASRWRPDARNYFGRLTKAQLLALATTFWDEAAVSEYRRDKKATLVEQFFHGPDDTLSKAQKGLRAR